MNDEQIRLAFDSGDLRTSKSSDSILAAVSTQADFDLIWHFLFVDDRNTQMKAFDAIEKISTKVPTYLTSHQQPLFQMVNEENRPIEQKWHIARMARLISWEDMQKESILSQLKA